MRIPFDRGRTQADLAQQLVDPLPALPLAADAVDDERLGQDVAHTHPRIE